MASLEEQINKLVVPLGEPGLSRERFDDLVERIKVLQTLIQEK